MDDPEHHAKVQEMVAQVETLMTEKRYDDVKMIGEELLPLIADEEHSVRLRIYHLLQRCPGFHLSAIHQWNARVVAEDVMADSKRTPEERIRAHVLSLLLNVFPPGASPPEGSTVDPHRRWLPQELRELYAERAATELLGRGGGGDPAIVRDAHIVRCFTCPDHQSVAAHLEALLADLDEEAIVMGCCGTSVEFHKETACQFLNRALAIVKEEKATARLLEYKLLALLALYQKWLREDTQDSEERHDALYKDFIATVAHLELCPNALKERVYGHLFFAAFAYWYDDRMLAHMHCDVAEALATHLQDATLQQGVASYRKSLLLEEDGAPGEGDERSGGEQDDDDDDDDEEDFWTKS